MIYPAGILGDADMWGDIKQLTEKLKSGTQV